MWRIPPGGFLGFSELELADSQGCFTCVRPQFWWIWNLMRIQAKRLILRAPPCNSVSQSYKELIWFPMLFCIYYAVHVLGTCTIYDCSGEIKPQLDSFGGRFIVLCAFEIHKKRRRLNVDRQIKPSCHSSRGKTYSKLKSQNSLMGFLPLPRRRLLPRKRLSDRPWTPRKKKKNIKIMRAQIAQTKMHKSCTFDGSQKSSHSLSTEISA